ncbi:Carbohydrate sulfotransferase 5 [Penaeus vannamei]|uniref:Carbohydrate sulfotransferase 5 n=1 Tax=Penaeus vannamei TaxID=6689 RepID=A0A423SP10_PENVA|nr:Carbohydrate sulfotransferase 5 [Penaeus vannamei]
MARGNHISFPRVKNEFFSSPSNKAAVGCEEWGRGRGESGDGEREGRRGSVLSFSSLFTLFLSPTAAAGGSEEYTLPSLEEVIQSVHDLDVQRVLRMYSAQHEEVPPGTPHVRVIVTSTWRSGSTFLAEILASHPGVYYHYEPLMPYGLQQLHPHAAGAGGWRGAAGCGAGSSR